MAVDVAPEVKWNLENRYRNLKVTVECEADDAAAAQRAAEAELQSRLKDLGSLKVVIGRDLEVKAQVCSCITLSFLNCQVGLLL